MNFYAGAAENKMNKIFFVLSLLLFSSPVWAMGKLPPKEIREEMRPSAAEGPLTVWNCYDLALERSETLAIQWEEVEKTKGNTLEAVGEAVGEADFLMTSYRQDAQKASGSSTSSVGSTLTAEHRRERKFILHQPVFQGFKALGALTGAGSLRHQREHEWERAKQLLFMDVAAAFWNVFFYQQDVEIIREIEKLFQERIEELRERVEIGRSRESEIATAQSRMKIIEAELAASQGSLATAVHMLEFLTGTAVSPEKLEDENVPEGPSLDLDFALLAAERSDVQAAEAAVQTARSGVIVAQSALWPEISLDSNLYEKREGFQSGTDWDLLLSFNIPLGKGGTTLGEVKTAWSEWKQSKYQYSLTERTALREIKDAYAVWQSTLARYKSLEEAVKAAQENYDFQKEEYTRNLVNNLDVLEALQSLFDTRRDANEAFYLMKQSYWDFQIAKGECCREDGAPLSGNGGGKNS